MKTTTQVSASYCQSLVPRLANYIPSKFNVLHVIGAASKIAAELAGEEEMNYGVFRDAVGRYLSDLPSDDKEAVTIITRDAQAAFGVKLEPDHDKLAAARQAVIDAEEELAAIERQRIFDANQRRELGEKIHRQEAELRVWEKDWQAVENNAKEVILQHFATPFALASVHDRSLLEGAFEDAARAPILRELAPAAIDRLKASIKSNREKLESLQPAKLPAPEPEPEPLIRGRQKLALVAD